MAGLLAFNKKHKCWNRQGYRSFGAMVKVLHSFERRRANRYIYVRRRLRPEMFVGKTHCFDALEQIAMIRHEAFRHLLAERGDQLSCAELAAARQVANLCNTDEHSRLG